jgi:hypothetical protein
MAVGLNQHHPGSVAKFAARRDEFFERRQPRFQCREILLSGANATSRLVERTPRGRQRSLLRSVLEADMVERFVCTPERVPGRGAIGLHLLRFDEDIGLFDLQLAKRLTDAASLYRGVFERVPQRGHGIGYRVDLRPGSLDVCFKRVYLLLRASVRFSGIGENASRLVARTRCVAARLFACFTRNACRFPPRLEVTYLFGDLRRAGGER